VEWCEPTLTQLFGNWAEVRGDVVADIEAWVFHRGVIAETVDAGADALLDAIANGPVLAIDEIPEFDGVHGIEIGLGHFVRMEEETALDASAIRSERPEQEGSGVIAGETQHEIGKAELPLVADLFVRSCQIW